VPDRSVFTPANIAISIIGGLAGATVFAVLSKGAFAGALLAQLSPLPVMIVALGLGGVHGATAALIGAVAVTLGLGPVYGMAYGLLVALPAWLACYAASGAPWGRRDLVTRSFSAWAVTALCASLSAAVVFFLALTFFSHGAIDEPLAYVQGLFYVEVESALKEQNLAESVSKAQLKQFVTLALPALAASCAVMLHALNLWIAGRLTQVSGMLKRAWPDIAQEYVLPRGVAVLFALSLVAALAGGFIGQTALVVASTCGLALAFQGLAATHFWLRGSKSGVVTLAILYFFVGALVAPIALFAIVGLLDMALHFRDRKLPAQESGRLQS